MSSVNLDVTGVLDITAKRGDTFSLTLTLKDSSGTALTLSTSNYEFYFVVTEVNNRKSSRSPRIVLASPNISGAVNTFESPSVDDSGNVTFTASSQTMSSISSGSYSYEIHTQRCLEVHSPLTETYLKRFLNVGICINIE